MSQQVLPSCGKGEWDVPPVVIQSGFGSGSWAEFDFDLVDVPFSTTIQVGVTATASLTPSSSDGDGFVATAGFDLTINEMDLWDSLEQSAEVGPSQDPPTSSASVSGTFIVPMDDDMSFDWDLSLAQVRATATEKSARILLISYAPYIGPRP